MKTLRKRFGDLGDKAEAYRGALLAVVVVEAAGIAGRAMAAVSMTSAAAFLDPAQAGPGGALAGFLACRPQAAQDGPGWPGAAGRPRPGPRALRGILAAPAPPWPGLS